tara:strand:- start:1137 stop:1496 length:360 start_codon:yes stop_codon:yes gene_type:complete
MNPIMNNTINNNTRVSDPWVESGAMVYVALTVATLSAVIMCCTWFIKQRFNKNGYGTLDVTADDEEEDIPLVVGQVELSENFSDDGDDGDDDRPPSAAFTMEDSSSEDGDDVNTHEDAV